MKKGKKSRDNILYLKDIQIVDLIYKSLPFITFKYPNNFFNSLIFESTASTIHGSIDLVSF